MSTHLEERWKTIVAAGGPEAFITQALKKKGVYREYRPDIMSIKNEQEKNAAIIAARSEAAERTKLRQFVWEARKATHIHYLGPDIFWNDLLKDDHFDPFNRQARLKDSQLPSLENLDELMVFLQSAVPELTVPMLRSYCYHREVSLVCHYRHFAIPKKTGGVRKIWAPMPRLKSLQRLILTEIIEKMATHGAAHGFIAGKSIYTNALEHTDSSVVVGIDLKNFFPTFTFPRVKGIFRSYGYPAGTATLLAALCTEAPRRVLKIDGKVHYVAVGPRALPQGSPASPALTNVACMRLDRRIGQYAHNSGWRYTRYADDITLSKPNGSRSDIEYPSVLNLLRHVVADEGLRINPKKTHIMTKGRRQEVTGLIVNGPGLPRVPRERRHLLRAALHNAQNAIEVDAEKALSIEQLVGHSAFVYLAQPELGRSLLDAFLSLGSSSAD